MHTEHIIVWQPRIL